MEVSVVTVVYNKPEFIKFHKLLLEKFLKNDFDYFVYDNSDNDSDSNRIRQTCSSLGVKYHRIPQNIFHGGGDSYRAGLSLDYSIKNNLENYESDFMLILDSDMFLYKDLEIKEYIGDTGLMGIYQTRGDVFYYTNQLCVVNLSKCHNFKDEVKFLPGEIRGNMTDCGGFLFEYINKYGITNKDIPSKIHSGTMNDSNIKTLLENREELKEFFETDIHLMGGKSFSEVFDPFFHFRAGSNWINFGIDISKERELNLFNLFDRLLKNK